MRDEERAARKSPWLFVPPLYFLQAIPYFLVDTAATTFFAAIGVPVAEVGRAAGFLKLPWTLKPFWSPLVDLVSTKRAWTLAMQALVVFSAAALAFAAASENVVLWTTVACALMATASATHDIAADGFYLLALDTEDQAAFVGVRNTFFRLGRIFVTGAVVYLVGTLAERGVEKPRAWAYAFAAGATAYAFGLLACALLLPRPDRDRSRGTQAGSSPGLALDAVRSYFARKGIAAILAFILLYRFGESMLTTMSPSFLLANVDAGGAGLSLHDISLYSGTVGVVALLLGGILGGYFIAKGTLSRWLWPMALAMHVPNLLYAWAAFTHPGKLAVAGVIAVEQLGYGFGFSVYMVVLMRVSRGQGFDTTHYAISTGLMGLSAMIASSISGEIAAKLGFSGFFVVVCACAVPSLLPLLFLRLEDDRSASR
jgi:PAT family beta-lactamase induction signal transducer AmpG